jgi:hypothetical protein
MSLVLQSSGGGSVTLQEAVTASNLTITVPATAGTMITTTGGVAPSTAGNVLTSNGTTWTSATPTTPVAGTGPAFSAYQSVQQTGISAATATKVTYNAEEFDTNNNFASSRFTPTVAGYYQIGGSAYASSAMVMVLWLYKNGSVYRTFGNTNNTNGTCLSGNALCYANGTTDYFEMYVYLGDGGSLDVSNNSRNWFTGGMVRAA